MNIFIYDLLGYNSTGHKIGIFKSNLPTKNNGLKLSIIANYLKIHIRNLSEIYFGRQSDHYSIPISIVAETDIILNRVYTQRLSTPYSN